MTTTTYNLTRYARCEIEELQLLEKYKVSGTATRIYLILRSFAREKMTCWPSLKTIAEVLGISSKSSIQIVSNALAKLVKCGLVVKNSPKSKQRFFLKARSELSVGTIKRKREVSVNENVYKTKPMNKSYSNNKEKYNKNITYKSQKKPYNKGFRKLGGFDGGINETYTKSDIHPIESAFSKAISQKTPLTPDQVSDFQKRMEQSVSFKLFVMAFHPPMYQRIMGRRLSDDEIVNANKKWTEMNVELITHPKATNDNKFNSVFDKLVSQFMR